MDIISATSSERLLIYLTGGFISHCLWPIMQGQTDVCLWAKNKNSAAFMSKKMISATYLTVLVTSVFRQKIVQKYYNPQVEVLEEYIISCHVFRWYTVKVYYSSLILGEKPWTLWILSCMKCRKWLFHCYGRVKLFRLRFGWQIWNRKSTELQINNTWSHGWLRDKDSHIITPICWSL